MSRKGTRKVRATCGDCGARVKGIARDEGDMIMLAMGSLEGCKHVTSREPGRTLHLTHLMIEDPASVGKPSPWTTSGS